jgi:AcrR family transcriptional regulator
VVAQSSSERKRPSRKEKALANRRRMVKAAYELFCERGFAAATMEAIAERAGVAVQTLYFTFNTKGALLGEAVGAAILGFERWTPLVGPAMAVDLPAALAELHPWFRPFEREPDARRAIGIFVDGSIESLERVAPLIGAAAAAGDPEVEAVRILAEQRRAEAFALITKILARKAGLREGVSRRRATDVLLVVMSAETYQQLRAGRGWSQSACRAWLVDVLSQQLLP